MQKAFSNSNKKSKQEILKDTSLNPDLPLIVFIGRLVNEKGGELLPQAIGRYLSRVGNVNFYVLGSGSSDIENQLQRVRELFTQSVATYIGYNEALAHKLYAGADFLIMPSIIEPCGLNQLYAMRYATVPMVRSVGGLKDTVVDIGDTNGYGIRFTNANVEDILYSVNRAVDLYANPKLLEEIRKRLVALNFSWEKAVKEYIEIYQY
ncbi:MAG: glycosyltransferase [Bacteroidetes bacterium]|nr:glycosyltransferase [Bacteroidota bacterium]